MGLDLPVLGTAREGFVEEVLGLEFHVLIGQVVLDLGGRVDRDAHELVDREPKNIHIVDGLDEAQLCGGHVHFGAGDGGLRLRAHVEEALRAPEVHEGAVELRLADLHEPVAERQAVVALLHQPDRFLLLDLDVLRGRLRAGARGVRRGQGLAEVPQQLLGRDRGGGRERA